MATLSANSRRNSAASSAPNSPRPSISGNLLASLTTHMSSVNEEVDDIEEKTSKVHFSNDQKKRPNGVKDRSCSERSDSGFSECSTNCGCTQSASNKLQIIFDIDDNEDDLHAENSGGFSHEVLASKLEKIAEQQKEGDCITKSDVSEKSSATPVSPPPNLSPLNDLEYDIKRFNLTNSIQTRKKSLESSMRKDSTPQLSVPLIHISPEKKVSHLKEKFDAKASKKDSPRTRSPNSRVFAKNTAGESSKTGKIFGRCFTYVYHAKILLFCKKLELVVKSLIKEINFFWVD